MEIVIKVQEGKDVPGARKAEFTIPLHEYESMIERGGPITATIDKLIRALRQERASQKMIDGDPAES